MKRNFFIIVLSLLFTTFVNASGVEKTIVPPAATASISGIIADLETSETLAGVLVSIEGTDIETLTDLDGKFSFEGLQAGDYSLKLSYISYSEVKVETIAAQGENQSLKLTLKSE